MMETGVLSVHMFATCLLKAKFRLSWFFDSSKVDNESTMENLNFEEATHLRDIREASAVSFNL